MIYLILIGGVLGLSYSLIYNAVANKRRAKTADNSAVELAETTEASNTEPTAENVTQELPAEETQEECALGQTNGTKEDKQ